MLTQKLEGLIAAPFTPMHKDGSLNLDLIPHYYQLLKTNNVNGAFICGSTGEGVSLTMREKIALTEAWASCAKEDKSFRVMPLLGGSCLSEIKELALHAREAGVYAVSFTSPFYFKPANVDALAECCYDIASTVPDMPFYYYHIPVLTGVGFAMYDLLKAVHRYIPSFTGIKYTHEDFMDFLSCMNFGEGKYDMLWGRDENFLPALSLGAKAAVGSTYNYAAPLYQRLMEAFENGDLVLAQKQQQLSIDMIRLLGKYGGIATGKAYMKLLGLDCGYFRLPVKNMSESAFEDFSTEAELLGFRSFCSVLPELNAVNC